jgi:hypothetical protein
MICINCNNEHQENFCPNCGEQATVKKITFRSIFNDVFLTITNMDKGFLFNLKYLFLNPRKIVLDYIHGKRKGIFNPLSFLIISVTIYLIGESLFAVSNNNFENTSKLKSIGYEAGQLIQGNFKYFWILSIIWLSFSSKLLFSGYNYAEHLVINSFIIGQVTLVGLIGFILFRIPIIFNPIIYILIFWMTYKIFKSKNKDWDIIFQLVVSTILFVLQLGLIVLFIALLIGVFKKYVVN